MYRRYTAKDYEKLIKEIKAFDKPVDAEKIRKEIKIAQDKEKPETQDTSTSR